MKSSKFEKDKAKGLIPSDAVDYMHVQRLIIDKLNAKYNIHLQMPKIDQDVIILNKKIKFGFETACTSVVVFHLFGGQDIMGLFYESTHEWADEVVSLLDLYINKTIRKEKYYRGKTLVKTRLVSIVGAVEEEIEAPVNTANIFKLFSKREFRIESEEMFFSLDL